MISKRYTSRYKVYILDVTNKQDVTIQILWSKWFPPKKMFASEIDPQEGDTNRRVALFSIRSVLFLMIFAWYTYIVSLLGSFFENPPAEGYIDEENIIHPAVLIDTPQLKNSSSNRDESPSKPQKGFQKHNRESVGLLRGKFASAVVITLIAITIIYLLEIYLNDKIHHKKGKIRT